MAMVKKVKNIAWVLCWLQSLLEAHVAAKMKGFMNIDYHNQTQLLTSMLGGGEDKVMQPKGTLLIYY